MAQLSSPGVSVSVIDESFYTPAAAGTTPLIIVASEENKQNGSGTGIAPGTIKANAGQVYLLTSQKDLADTFGTPIFKTDANNNPIHAGEQNEYGLQTAYSYLGVSNRAFVVRADLDVKQLDASADAPAGLPANGTYWFDTASTSYGIFEWNSSDASITNGQSFVAKTPIVITDVTKVTNGADEKILANGYLIESPSWAPNGRLLIFSSTNRGGNGVGKKSKLYMVDITGKYHQILNVQEEATDPMWSSRVDFK
jgi:hypothetical protein